MRRLVFILLGGLVALVAAELLFRILPVSTATYTGYYVHPNVLTYPPDQRFTMSTGWDLQRPLRHQANNFGFLSTHDFYFNPGALGLVGDSFVEANMLAPEQRLAAQIEKRLAGRQVYAFGGPGSNLLDYAQRIAFAYDKFGIREFVVVLERWDVLQSLCGSGNIHAHCIDPVSLQAQIVHLAPPGQLKKIVRESALAQYLFSQLKFDFSKWAFPFGAGAVKTQRRRGSGLSDAQSAAILARFFELLPKDSGLKLTVVIDPNRNALFDDVAQRDLALERLTARLQESGAQMVSLTDVFRADWASNHLGLSVSPQDGHWNARTVAIVAQTIHSRLCCRRDF